jgi:GDSL-like Lipase/Acylhydrolase family
MERSGRPDASRNGESTDEDDPKSQIPIETLERATNVRGPVIASVIVAATGGALFVTGRTSDQPLLSFAAKLLLLVGIASATFAWGSRRLLGASRAKTAMQNMALVLGGLLVAAVLGEFAVRIALRGITTTGRGGYFFHRWTAGHVRLNSAGFREREFDAVKPVGVYRIAILGDSFAFGFGIEESERFGNLIAEALGGTGAGVEVLNFGRAGADTGDELEILKKTVLPVRPDYVLLQWFVNDFEMSRDTRPEPLPLVPSWTLERLLHRYSATYYVCNERWVALQGSLGLYPSYADYMWARFADPFGVDSQAEISALTEFLRVLRANNIPMGIVLFPDLRVIKQESYPFGYLHGRVLKLCDEQGMDCLDLRGLMARASTTSSLKVNRFDGHPNALANRIAADALLERFGSTWLAGSGQKPLRSSK